MKLSNLDEIDRNPNPKPHYIIETISIAEGETEPTMNAHEFIIFKIKFDLHNL